QRLPQTHRPPRIPIPTRRPRRQKSHALLRPTPHRRYKTSLVSTAIGRSVAWAVPTTSGRARLPPSLPASKRDADWSLAHARYRIELSNVFRSSPMTLHGKIQYGTVVL